MKKIKILFAVIAVFTLLFTVVSAEESALKFGADTVQYTEGENLTISVYANEGFVAFAGGSFEIVFNDSVWAYDSAAFNTDLTADGFVSGEDGTGRADAISVVISGGTNKTLAVDQKIVDLTFTKKAGDAAGTTFVLDFNVFGGNLLYSDGAKYFEGTITVEAAASDERVDGAVTNATKSELLLGDTWYQNLAVFDTAITLDPAKNAKQYGWTLKAAGKADKEVSYSPATAISGEGSVAFAAIVYNVPENVTVTAVPFVVYGN